MNSVKSNTSDNLNDEGIRPDNEVEKVEGVGWIY